MIVRPIPAGHFEVTRWVQQPGAGFTLVEILTAIFIFAVVMTGLLTAYRTVFSHVEIIRWETTIDGMARNCLNRIVEDLQAIYVVRKPAYRPPGLSDPPDPYRIRGKVAQVGAGTFTELRFASLAHLDFNPAAPAGSDGREKPQQRVVPKGIARIVYYVASAGQASADEAGYQLKRSDQLYPFEAEFAPRPSDPTVSTDVKTFSVQYLDRTGEAYAEWDSDSEAMEYATPAALEITLELGQGDDTVTFQTRVALPVNRDKHGDKSS